MSRADYVEIQFELPFRWEEDEVAMDAYLDSVCGYMHRRLHCCVDDCPEIYSGLRGEDGKTYGYVELSEGSFEYVDEYVRWAEAQGYENVRVSVGCY